MKVVLSVAENWHRRYLVEIPDNLAPAEWDDAAVAKYLTWLNRTDLDIGVSPLGEPEYIDDGPSSAHLVIGKYEEFGGYEESEEG